MRALVINQSGGPEQLQIREVPIPERKRGEILVRVHAAGINPVDYKIRKGITNYRLAKKLSRIWKFPLIPGSDIAGEVKQADRRSGYKPGDKVFAMLPTGKGGYCEFTTVKEHHLCLVPAVSSFTEAAATPLASLTALQAFQKGGKIKEGDKILINGASGGVGSFAVQIARAMGAHVTGVCSSDNIMFVKDLGANEVIDYKSEDFTRSNNRYRKVFDAAGKSSFDKCRRILAGDGIYVSTLPGRGMIISLILNFLRKKKASLVMVKPSGKDLLFMSGLMEAGLVRPAIMKTFLLEEGAKAHELLETGKTRGKIVLELTG